MPEMFIVLQPPRNAPRFRCPCGVVLSGASWICNICRHSNSSSLQACVGCGNQRGPDSQGANLNANLPQINAEGRLQRESASKAFRLRRANQLSTSRKQWRRRGSQNRLSVLGSKFGCRLKLSRYISLMWICST